MECKDIMMQRRSIHAYTEEEVTLENLHYILNMGMQAPSELNFQPWYFVVIRSKDQMERLLMVAEGVSTALNEKLRTRFARNPEVAEESLRFIRILGNAPVCILAFRHKEHYTKSDKTIVQSISAAMENILLVAVDRGLGGRWMTAPVEAGDGAALRATFAPGKGKLVAMMPIGHPVRIPPAPARTDGWCVIL